MSMLEILIWGVGVYSVIIVGLSFKFTKYDSQVNFILVILWFFGVVLNSMFGEFISLEFFEGKYLDVIYVVQLTLVFIVGHIVAFKKDWEVI